MTDHIASTARPRGRPARATAPVPATQLDARSIRYITTATVYADGADVATAQLCWREGLNQTGEQLAALMSETTARVTEYAATLADIESREKQTTARMEECRTTADTAPAALESLKVDVAAGRRTLEELAIAKARVDVAREMLPAVSAAHRDIATEMRDAERALNDARRDLSDLQAVEAWQALQSALFPVQGAIADWLKLTGDAALYIGAPGDET